MKKRILLCLPVLLLLLGGCGSISNLIQSLQQEPPYIEVTVEDSLLEDRFYYEQLPEEEQLIYKEIYQGILEEREEICLHSKDAETVTGILPSVIYDFPEIFWTDGSGTATSYEGTYTILELNYSYTGEKRTVKEAEIEAAASGILDTVPGEYSEYEKIKYIFEYLVDSIEYVEDAPDNQNIYSALVRKESVCAGYAKANQYLLDRLGIYCIYVIGTANGQEGQEGHAWNVVQCDGKYYCVDATWGDPMFSDEEQYAADEIIYDYLCCDDKTLAETHTKDGLYAYPECNSDDLNYYRLNQMYYEEVNERQLQNAMYQSINAKESSITFKFANYELYSRAKAMFENRLLDTALDHLGNRYGLREAQCYYNDIDDLNKFVIYWQYE